MTLRQLRARYPEMFYAQDWFEGEAFLDVEAEPMPGVPSFWSWQTAPRADGLPTAATLALAYVNAPKATVWRKYLWTRDVDRWGQRVFVGGLGRSGKFEVHRQLHITDDWGVPRWEAA